MKIIKETENLNSSDIINESNDLRENISSKYSALEDLNKATTKINEAGIVNLNTYMYNKNEMLTENYIFRNNEANI